MIITSADSSSEESVARAVRLAEELSCRYVNRDKRSIAKLISVYKDPDILIITDQEIRYMHPEKPPLHFHPSMSFVRVKRLIRGEQDPLVAAACVVEGDKVLDCTAGFAADSILFSYAVGASGQVTALESELCLYALIKEGLATYVTDVHAMNDAMRRIQIKHADHAAYLKTLPDRSQDVIYFDPMFREPLTDSSSINSLRGLANHNALELETIEEAKRVARKTVVLKEQRDSTEFKRLGFHAVHRNSSNIAYGVIQIDREQ